MRHWQTFIAVVAAAGVVVRGDRPAHAGVTFKQAESAPPPAATAAETRLPPALTLSNQLGERAADAAASGDLEAASRLAELSAQAMTGELTRNDLAKVKIAALEDAPPLPLAPAVIQAQQAIARDLRGRIATSGADDGARAANVAAFRQLGAAYRRLRDNPSEAREVLATVAAAGSKAAAKDGARPPAAVTAAGDAAVALPPAAVAVTMMLVPAGRCAAGSPAEERGRKPTEGRGEITIARPFLLSRTEVTQGQFKAVTGQEPWSGRPGVRAGEHFPATWVSWGDAAAFCDRLTERERAAGRLAAAERYRLPTEAEWEYACRADSATAYSFGDDAARLGIHAWFKGNAAENGRAGSHHVGTRQPNAWGLHDMHGNVLEWCADRYRATGVAADDSAGARDGAERSCRGGSWAHDAADCRSASRFAVAADVRDDVTGFRIARDVAAP